MAAFLLSTVIFFLCWMIIGLVYSTYHICHYPNCCPYHPDLVSPIKNKGRISASGHYCHLFCRYVFNSLSMLFLIPISITALIAWIMCSVYYILLSLCCHHKEHCTESVIIETKRVAVIGAGPSGLVTAKYLLCDGHNVTIFEKSNAIGGSFAWSYPGLLTTSTFITQFSDLAINEDDLMGFDQDIKSLRIKSGTFVTFKEYCNYLIRYSNTFNVFERILFNSAIINMKFNAKNKEWILFTASSRYTFDHVAICTGIASKPNIPQIMMASNSNIQVIHSKSFEGENDVRIEDKNVLIIGCGESGSDISFIVSKVCNKYNKKCLISTRNGPGYIIPRFFGGIPSDADTSRMYHYTREWGLSAPIRFKRWMEGFWITPYDDIRVLKEAKKINKRMSIGPFGKYGTKSIAFINGIIDNKLEYTADIVHIDFVSKEVLFADDSVMKECDIIICCTGYKSEFNFFESKTKIKLNQLFQRMFHIDYGDSLCFIGLNRPFIGSLPPISEMSARYYSLIVSSLKQLPSKQVMLDGIQSENEQRKHQFPLFHDQMPILCDFLTKYDALSRLIGCDTVNNLNKLFVVHPLIWCKVLTKTIQSVQFKVYGPHKSNLNKIYELLSASPRIPIPVLLIEFMVYIVYSIFKSRR